MIFVLFGPPGVGKTYIGHVLEKKLKVRFFDADVLFDDEYRRLIRAGQFSDDMREKFIEKLSDTVDYILAKMSENEALVIAQAFTKDKSRLDFLRRFDNQVRFVLVNAPKDLAHNRVLDRLKNLDHIIDESAFEYVWRVFERPTIKYDNITNDVLDNDKIVKYFKNLLEEN